MVKFDKYLTNLFQKCFHKIHGLVWVGVVAGGQNLSGKGHLPQHASRKASFREVFSFIKAKPRVKVFVWLRIGETGAFQ